MAKYQIKKEYDDEGDIMYRIYKDGRYMVSATTEQSANEKLDRIIETQNIVPEIIKEIEA